MNWITDLFNHVSKIFQWWIIVLPWEQGIRVRLGKHKTLLHKGIYLKLPVIDQVFIQTTRIRFISLPIQTLTTLDGETVTINGSVGYCITNIEKLYETIYNPESTISAISGRAIAEYVASHNIKDCLPEHIKSQGINILKESDYGLGDLQFAITGYAKVKTFRLIQDASWFPGDNYNDKYKA